MLLAFAKRPVQTYPVPDPVDSESENSLLSVRKIVDVRWIVAKPEYTDSMLVPVDNRNQAPRQFVASAVGAGARPAPGQLLFMRSQMTSAEGSHQQGGPFVEALSRHQMLPLFIFEANEGGLPSDSCGRDFRKILKALEQVLRPAVMAEIRQHLESGPSSGGIAVRNGFPSGIAISICQYCL
jgi:hypothetical protein